jgi:alkyldihydroxyacetonephosphate synthase
MIAAAIAAALPGIEVSENDADRVAYARDLWPRHLVSVRQGRVPGTRPQAIVWPRSPEEVAAVVSFCAARGVPIVPFGAGSGVCGGILPDQDTVVVDLKKLSRVRRLDRDAHLLDVEAGAMGIGLEEDLQRAGVTVGHFPSSILCSTVGGWIAARGAGQASGKYGKIEDAVVGLEIVDGRGEIRHLRRRRSDVDLIPLVTGSEGILGVITSATLRVHDAPSARSFGAFGFRTTEEGWEAMRAIFQAGLRPAVARLYDPFDAALARRGSVSSGRGDRGDGPRPIGRGASILRGLLAKPPVARALNAIVDDLEGHVPGRGFDASLVLVFEGDAASTADGLAAARAILRERSADDLGEGPARSWLEHRYSVSYRQPPTIRQGLFLDTMEVAAPWSALGRLYRDVREALGRDVFVMAHLSHAYPDGCSIYFTFAGAVASDAPSESIAQTEAKYDEVWRRALDAAIAAGGTLSHHHGVGRSKAPRLGAELGHGVAVVRALARAFDPSAILNRGNLLPARDPAVSSSAWRREVEVDRASLLVHAPAAARLEEIEAAARRVGATLGLGEDPREATVGDWLSAGTPGVRDPLADPVDHAIAGLEARMADGHVLAVRAAPRRAVGPDLIALVVGARDRFATPLSAAIRIHLLDAPAVSTDPVEVDRDPPLGEGEAALVEAIGRALGASPN